jgi:hypothetical protein
MNQHLLSKKSSALRSLGQRIPASLLRFPAFVLAGIAVSYSCLGATVAEWKFNEKEDIGGGTVKLDTAVPGAASEAILMPQTIVSAAPTGISQKWKPFLQTGFLDIGKGSGEGNENQNGLTTGTKAEKAPGAYYKYMGFQGLGSGEWDDGSKKGGTVYLVVSPKPGGWGEYPSRFGLMGTGHNISGGVSLLVTKDGNLQFRVLAGSKPVATASITQQWESGKWYFIAASWREDEKPVLYVREMVPAGIGACPTAVQSLGDTPAPALPEPEQDPIVIGASWIETGSKAATADGGNAKIAYARIDNTFSSAAEIDGAFKALAAE